jgi:hypothetical protein
VPHDVRKAADKLLFGKFAGRPFDEVLAEGVHEIKACLDWREKVKTSAAILDSTGCPKTRATAAGLSTRKMAAVSFHSLRCRAHPRAPTGGTVGKKMRGLRHKARPRREEVMPLYRLSSQQAWRTSPFFLEPGLIFSVQRGVAGRRHNN